MVASSTLIIERCRRRIVLIRHPSHEKEYEGPTRRFHHGFIAGQWTSWIEGNPGRRFYGCQNYYQDGGCGFLAWHDSEFSDMANEMIKDLLNDKDKLYDERTQLQQGNDADELYKKLVALHGEVRKLKASCGNRESDLGSIEMKFKVAMVILIIIWVWLVVLYAYCIG